MLLIIKYLFTNWCELLTWKAFASPICEWRTGSKERFESCSAYNLWSFFLPLYLCQKILHSVTHNLAVLMGSQYGTWVIHTVSVWVFLLAGHSVLWPTHTHNGRVSPFTYFLWVKHELTPSHKKCHRPPVCCLKWL